MPRLADTLRQVAEAMRAAEDPWWIIGSAAIWLHGVPTSVADIDLLVSQRDGTQLLATWPGGVSIGTASDRFRSHPFARLDGAAMPVEMMADMELYRGGTWCPVRLTTRVERCGVFVPERAELVALLHAFGRPKDLARADVIAAADREAPLSATGKPSFPRQLNQSV